MQDQWFTFNMFDAQAWFVRDVILGRIALPEQQQMREHSQQWRQREEGLSEAAELIDFQGDYVDSLIKQTDYPSFDIDGAKKVFLQWIDHKQENILTFRDKLYQSVLTGTMATPHHTRWLEAMDDSMASYLASPIPRREKQQERASA